MARVDPQGVSMKYGARIYLFILLTLAAVDWPGAQAAPTGRRVALVIGNSAYEHTTVLRNPVNDAKDIATVLGRLGFELVTTYDANAERFTAAVEEFSRKMSGAQAALFYYAGHGVQFAGRNYLLPVDAKLSSEFALKREAIAADDVIQPMENAERVNIVFLDSCRNNPLAEQLKRSIAAPTRAASVGRGLAPVEPSGRDTLIVFSTAPGEEAEDGGGRHSPFTDALLRHIETPGVDVEVMLKRVTGDVRKATGEKQRPERLARLAKEFSFNPTDGEAIKTQPSPQVQPTTTRRRPGRGAATRLLEFDQGQPRSGAVRVLSQALSERHFHRHCSRKDARKHERRTAAAQGAAEAAG